MADKKIPLLTDVYQPKTGAATEAKPSDWIDLKPRQDAATLITPELIARIAAHIKPRLEADIEKSVTESVRETLKKELIKALQDEVLSTQAAIEARTVDFVDKTKADLKTELPNMYQASADLVYNSLTEKLKSLQNEAISKADATLAEVVQGRIQSANMQIGAHVETLKTETNANISHAVSQEMQAFQVQALDNHQTLLREELNAIFQETKQNAKVELQQHLEGMQADAATQMRTTFTEAMPDIYNTAVEEQQEVMTAQISQQLNTELQAFQVQAAKEHQSQLTQSLADVSNTIRQNAQAEMQAQLQLMQTEVAEQIRATLNASISSIYEAAADDVKAKFAEEMTVQTAQARESFLATINADLPAV